MPHENKEKVAKHNMHASHFIFIQTTLFFFFFVYLPAVQLHWSFICEADTTMLGLSDQQSSAVEQFRGHLTFSVCFLIVNLGSLLNGTIPKDFLKYYPSQNNDYSVIVFTLKLVKRRARGLGTFFTFNAENQFDKYSSISFVKWLMRSNIESKLQKNTFFCAKKIKMKHRTKHLYFYTFVW